jgi:hypothetical protein
MYIHTQIPSYGTEVISALGAATNTKSFRMPIISRPRSPVGFVRSLAHDAGRTFLIHVYNMQAYILRCPESS